MVSNHAIVDAWKLANPYINMKANKKVSRSLGLRLGPFLYLPDSNSRDC